MHKYNTITIGLIFSLFSFSAAAVKMQNNDFCINGSDWNYIGFNLESYAVTVGQPWGGIKKGNQPKQRNCIRVESGRKASLWPLQWATLNSINPNNIIVANSYYPPITNPNPVSKDGKAYLKSANFAFFGTLVLIDKNGNQFLCPNIVIGQSGYNFANTNGISINPAVPNVWYIFSNYTTNVLQCSSDGVTTPIYLNLNSSGSKSNDANNTFKIKK